MMNILSNKYILNNYTKIINNLIFLYLFSILFFSDREGLNIYSNLIAFVLITNIFFYFIITNKKIIINSFIFIFIFFTIYSYLSMFWAIDPYISLTKSITLSLLLILIILLFNYIDTKDKLFKIIHYFVSISFIASLYLLFRYNNHYYYDRSFGSELGNVNFVSLFLSISSILCFYLFIINTTLTKKFIYFIILLILIITILLTGSRKSFLLIIFNISFILIMINKKNLRKIANYSLISLLIIFLSFILIFKINFLYNNIGRRFEFIYDFFTQSYKETSMFQRYNMIDFGLRRFFEKPFLGYGTDNYRLLYNSYFNLQTYSHSNFIELSVDLGVFGLILYYLLFIILFYKLRKLINNTYDIILGYTFISILFSYFIFLSWMVVYYDSKLLIIIFALILSYLKINNNKNTLNRID